MRRFSAWCAEEGETVRDELLDIKPPKPDVTVVPRLTDEARSRRTYVRAAGNYITAPLSLRRCRTWIPPRRIGPERTAWALGA